MPAVRKARLKRRNPLELAVAAVILVATLYFAQDVLIPLALSLLLTFLLTPLVARLQRWGLPAIPAVLTTTLAAFVVVSGLATVIGFQLYHLAEALPQYQQNISEKIESVSRFGGRFGDKFSKFGNALSKTPLESASQPATLPTISSTTVTLLAQTSDKPEQAAAREVLNAPATQPTTRGAAADTPVYVVDASQHQSPLRMLLEYVGTVLNPIGTGALVVVFVVFMLLDRQDIRDRAIRLLSRGKYTVTTRALDDAGHRISRYVLAQTIVNGSYGVVVGFGLFFIGLYFRDITGVDANGVKNVYHVPGFPSWVLWGLLAATLRFIPYVGPVTAAIFPLALSLAVYHGFGVFVAVGLFLILLELISNNVMEPWLYGSSTGLSTMAILVAAVFWTWLWGPIGLFMSTPLTVCIVVLGKYVTQLKFLDVMLGDQPALPPGVRFYQRLLATDVYEADLVMQEVARRDGADMVPDDVVLPALRMARRDERDGDLSAEEGSKFLETAAELLSRRAAESEQRAREAAAALPEGVKSPSLPPCPAVLGCPSHHRAEELTLEALSQLGMPDHYCVDVASSRLLPAQIEQRVREKNPNVVFIAVLPPGGMPQARYLCRRLRKAFPDLPIVVGVWGRMRHFDKLLVRFRKAGASYVTTSMVQSRNQIMALLKSK